LKSGDKWKVEIKRNDGGYTDYVCIGATYRTKIASILADPDYGYYTNSAVACTESSVLDDYGKLGNVVTKDLPLGTASKGFYDVEYIVEATKAHLIVHNAAYGGTARIDWYMPLPNPPTVSDYVPFVSSHGEFTTVCFYNLAACGYPCATCLANFSCATCVISSPARSNDGFCKCPTGYWDNNVA